jgi:hypothetical protein
MTCILGKSCADVHNLIWQPRYVGVRHYENSGAEICSRQQDLFLMCGGWSGQCCLRANTVLAYLIPLLICGNCIHFGLVPLTMLCSSGICRHARCYCHSILAAAAIRACEQKANLFGDLKVNFPDCQNNNFSSARDMRRAR